MTGEEPGGAYETTVEHFGPRPGPGATILVGVDGSDTSMRAAAYAFGLARRGGDRLLVAFVAARSGLVLSGPAVVFEQRALERLCAELRAETRRRAEELAVPVTFLVIHGDPGTILRETAERCQADTVVVGASTGAGHRIAGSVAARLIRAARRPVVVVP